MKRISLYILFIVCTFSCGKKESTNDKQEETIENSVKLSDEQIKAIGLNTTLLQQKAIDKTIRLNGKVTVSPSHLVSVSSIIGGRVKSISVLPGNYFKKGQLLVVLEDEQFVQLQQDYLIAKAKLESARLDYERQKGLNSNKASSDKTFQLAEAEYKTITVTKKALEEKLKLIYINPETLTAENISSSIVVKAPFNGVVSKLMINTGKYVNASEILMELINTDGLLLSLKAFETNITGLQVGQEILAYTNQNPDKKLKAKIISVVPNIENDGSADIVARFSASYPEVISGLYINANVTLKNFNTGSLPEKSIVSFENNNYVFEKTNDNTFVLIPVKVGNSSNGFTEIIDSEKVVEKKIVEKGSYDLLMALKNQVQE